MTRAAVPTSEAGFTLIEVMIGLAVAALALWLVIPNFGAATGGSEMRAASRDMVSALRRARGMAIVENRAVEVAFDARRGIYRIDAAVYPLLARTTGGPLAIALNRREPTGAVTAADRLVFHASGASSGGRLTLSRGADARLIDIDATTGRISVVR